MQAYVYCRVSGEEQAGDNHYSLENQEQRARDYCKSKGWRVADISKEVASGKDTNRAGFQELAASVRGRSVNVVVVYRLDRLSRNVRDIYDFLDLISQHDVALVSLCESLDTTTAMGRAMLGVMAVFAQLTREMIAENVKDGLMRRAQSGLYIGPKSGPLGYTYDPQQNALIPVEDEAEIVRQVFHLFVDRKWGVEKITQYLNESRTPTKTEANWHKSLIGRILRNPVYVGKLRWHDEVFPGTHKGIVAEEVYQAAQELISSRSRLPGRSHQSRHLLSGLAECGRCGKRLIAHYGPAKKNGERHVFYFHRASRLAGGCKSFYRSARKLEGVVLAEVRAAAESEHLSGIAVEEICRQVASKAGPLNSRRESILSELGEIKGKFSSWADRLDRGLIDEEQFGLQNSRLLKRKQELQEELGQIDRELAEGENAEVSLEAARKALGSFADVWDSLEMEERRELVRLLVEKLEVHRDHLVVKIAFLPEKTLVM